MLKSLGLKIRISYCESQHNYDKTGALSFGSLSVHAEFSQEGALPIMTSISVEYKMAVCCTRHGSAMAVDRRIWL